MAELCSRLKNTGYERQYPDDVSKSLLLRFFLNVPGI